MNKVIFLLGAVVLIGAQAYAGLGQEKGGGDMCEDRIKVVRDDLATWIKRTGHEGLQLPQGISKEAYAKEMLNQIAIAKISCVGPGDQGYPVVVDGTPKVCRFDLSSQESRITCDYLKFNFTAESNQYVLIHHEYGGLAKIEQPNGDDSDYRISNQISGFLEDQIVKKLVVRPSGGTNKFVPMTFQPIPAGSFMMGSPETEAGRGTDERQHQVTLTYNFEMQTTTVTQYQWFQVMGTNPSVFDQLANCPNTYMRIGDVDLCPNHPVERVSYDDISLFLRRLRSVRPDGYEYRLPTEAEWEYAARAGTTSAYFFGESALSLGRYAIFSENSGGEPADVQTLKPNPYGLYDMYGNIWQRVRDFYGPYPTDPQIDPAAGPEAGSFRVIRGGSWNSDASYLRSGFRYGWEPGYRDNNVGFRLVRTK